MRRQMREEQRWKAGEDGPGWSIRRKRSPSFGVLSSVSAVPFNVRLLMGEPFLQVGRRVLAPRPLCLRCLPQVSC